LFGGINGGDALGFKRDPEGNYVDNDGRAIDDEGYLIDPKTKERTKSAIIPADYKLPEQYNDPSKYRLSKDKKIVIDIATGKPVKDKNGKAVDSHFVPESGGEE
jgi:hypothetical protein